MRLRRLRRSELPADTVELARYLIGKGVVHDHPRGRMSGRIVETEAYPPGDAASHAYRRKTARNAVMYMRRGHAYVYFTYGNHFMLNVTSEEPEIGAAVLIRAVEPLEGIALMEQFRGTTVATDLTRGPGRLAEAFDIDFRHNGADLCVAGPLWLGAGAAGEIAESIRIGITRDAERVLRFYERGNPYVSGSKKLRS
jgi:DNA-3-methyladenine glycosylase